MSSSLFSMVIMLSPLTSRMLIYIFLLLSIIIIFYNLFGARCHISGKFYLFGWLQPLGFSHPSLNLSCSLVFTRLHVLLSTWMTSCYWFTLIEQVKGLAHFCVPSWVLFVSWCYVVILSICPYLCLLIG